jgi:uncharacterized protein (TIGR00156 family)
MALIAALVSACTTMHQQPVAATPIQAVLAQAKDDQHVVVRGQVQSRLDDHRYVVSDGSGSIRVAIDDDVARRSAIGVGSRVEVSGEVDTNFFHDPTIRADRVAVLSPGAAGSPLGSR